MLVIAANVRAAYQIISHSKCDFYLLRPTLHARLARCWRTRGIQLAVLLDIADTLQVSAILQTLPHLFLKDTLTQMDQAKLPDAIILEIICWSNVATLKNFRLVCYRVWSLTEKYK